jgi:hypothetical protein
LQKIRETLEARPPAQNNHESENKA